MQYAVDIKPFSGATVAKAWAKVSYLLKLKTKIEGNCTCYRTRKIDRKLAGKIKIPKKSNQLVI